MRQLLFFIFRCTRFIFRKISFLYFSFIAKGMFYIFNVSYAEGFTSNGLPIVDINPGCKMKVGSNLRLNNSFSANRIGRQQPCFFVLNHNGQLTIGDNVGLSSTAIICHHKITIGNNVRTGGNTVIYDTDFHSLHSHIRQDKNEDQSMISKKPINIQDNVFIGAHSTILKGVTIGKNSIVGACSVVTKDIPDNQIWAGNPAQFIRNI
ncbi:acyltransferase [Spirosoma utsteinense]|uniref:Acetyltransferase-like isoleucine patch superfamily enzyme n=1 Tax=Spirosoma utsteinense TaxID=2585773 RepID=A0ABR6WGD9_9BACT|nr:acyltransferase [Spirosoma utsteinense]MBC3788250.1 acetyltransferase-like isoleucine patch superfamily enzyme [Spirosoma utsteinense]MBC3795328.1 acetyltransferase-like isoleucine patch superfamily enzyme [Spirosoma utsteinense]